MTTLDNECVPDPAGTVGIPAPEGPAEGRVVFDRGYGAEIEPAVAEDTAELEYPAPVPVPLGVVVFQAG